MEQGRESHKRLTIDLSPEAHRSLKGTCAQVGMSMREFVLMAIRKQLEDLEEEMDVQLAEQAYERIKSGEDKLVSWDQMVKRLGWHEL